MTNTDICPFCETIVKTCDKAMCCDLCSKLIHIKYNNLNDLDYEYLDYKVRMKSGTVKLVFRKLYHFATRK